MLVTRPLPAATDTARRLQRMGYNPVIAPQLHVEFKTPRTVNTENVQALLVTSPQAALALKAWKHLHRLPALAVGDKTATLLERAGFKNVHSASGDAVALVGLVNATCKRKAGALLLAGAPSTGRKLAVDLRDLGYAVRRLSVYAVAEADVLSTAAVTFMKDKKSVGVLFYSARTARTFVNAVKKARLKDCAKHLNAYCISAAVAKAAQQLPWQHVYNAGEPTEDALLGLLPKKGKR